MFRIGFNLGCKKSNDLSSKFYRLSKILIWYPQSKCGSNEILDLTLSGMGGLNGPLYLYLFWELIRRPYDTNKT